MPAENDQKFLGSVNRMLDQVIGQMDLPPGLAEETRGCNSVYQVRFPVKIRGPRCFSTIKLGNSVTGWL